MKMDTRPDETFWSPEYSKRPFLKCQKYKYAKAQILYASKKMILRVCRRGIVEVNLTAALGDESCTRPPQTVLAVRDFPIPYCRPESRTLYLRSLLTNYKGYWRKLGHRRWVQGREWGLQRPRTARTSTSWWALSCTNDSQIDRDVDL